MLKKHPEIVALATITLLLASKFYFLQFYVGTAFQQLLMVAMSAAQGWVLGWFLSPKAKKFRQFLMIAGSVLLVAVAIGDRGKLGWSVFTLLAVICFIIAFNSWFKVRLGGFFEKPTTFGSSEWATFDYIKENKLLGTDGIRLGEAAP